MVISTKELRQSELSPFIRKIQVNVCREIINETTDEKLLGMIISNDLTWKALEWIYDSRQAGYSTPVISLGGSRWDYNFSFRSGLYFMQSSMQPKMKSNHFYHTILPNITLLYVKRAIPNAYLVLCEECWVVLLGIS